MWNVFIAHSFLLSYVRDFKELFFEIVVSSIEKFLQLPHTKCNCCGCDKFENVSAEGSCVILNMEGNYGL